VFAAACTCGYCVRAFAAEPEDCGAALESDACTPETTLLHWSRVPIYAFRASVQAAAALGWKPCSVFPRSVVASISCEGRSPMHFTYWSAEVVRPATVPQL